MPVGFGFSVGDFIAGINLLIDIVKSFSKSHGAKADYQELGRELVSLKNALESIQALSLNTAQAAQVSAVNTAVDGCHLCVDGFVQRNSKFRSLESAPKKQWSLAAFKNGVLGVKWAILKKNKVARFRADVQAHSNGIQMLLATLQQTSDESKLRAEAEQRNDEHKALTESIDARVTDLGLDHRRIENALGDQRGLVKNIHHDTQVISGQHASLALSMKAQHEDIKIQIQMIGDNQNNAFTVQNMRTVQLNANLQNLNTRVEALKTLERLLMGEATPVQEHMLQTLLQSVIQNQQQILGQVRELKTMLRVSQDVPPQVLLSTPVILLDARGQSAPFYLEFIDSAEAFVAVLKVRFKDTGLRKIETGQYALEDTRRKQGLKLTEPWTKIVRPGQHISMSMIFRLHELPTTKCPSCGKENRGSNAEEIQCGDITCRMTYRRIVELRSPSNEVSTTVQNGDPESSSSQPEAVGSGTKRREGNREDGSGEDEIRNYTRVHILTRAADSVLEPRNRDSELREARLGKRPKSRTVPEEIVAPSTSPRRMMTDDTKISAQRHFEVSNSMVVGSESISVMSIPQTRRPAMAGLITTGVFMAGGGYDKFKHIEPPLC